MYKKVKYPLKFLDLAKRRTKELLAYHLLSTHSIQTLLSSAYLQGIEDAVEVFGEKGLLHQKRGAND